MWRARAWIGPERSRARVLVGRCAHRRAGCDPPMLQYARLVRAPRVVNAARNRLYHDYIRYATPGGTLRIPLTTSKNILGVATSRGNRSHQADYYAFTALSLDPEELRLSVKKQFGYDWDPAAVGDNFNRQVAFVGIYDGHGGSAVSQYLRQELHSLFENVNPSIVPELFRWIREIGGYFKRYNGGPLEPWTHDDELAHGPFDLEARATAAFFEANRQLAMDKVAFDCGAAASVVLMQSLDAPATPFFAADKLAVTVAHVGDTRVLLCSAKDGTPLALTENHRPDSPAESSRLRKRMAAVITDSYGEARWMGALQSTRAFGDLNFAKFGITVEPDIRAKLLRGRDWGYMICVSDGITSMLSDAEIVDLARNARNSETAAKRILDFAQDLGGDDNATALVLPLAGWNKVQGPDHTKELREYRYNQMAGSSERMRRM
ncbi:protein serine/threonine phosphatase 2C [Schizophyllum commune H4-8]|uniref:protein serine/threonine phosphatase 2C n=1 Tax=Schizophyllum commune (strain H4-8 / FGSC 9210) TaxID=578458 RepID=UPI00215F747C|nr:protein serine/threonine phosphatase 2C [Schizophyllum commune H4-8]KAI5898413.1 protein serine/threonine phosphatase 2C [Schizophyllum commune H4-8]